MNQRFSFILVVTLFVAIVVSAIGLLSYVWFQLSSGYLHGDALIFQTVGRGMLSGYRPYVDLFETKPPGVFLLHALSWKLFGSQFLVSLVSVVALLGIPFAITIPAIHLIEDRPVDQRKLLSLSTILFGILLALYMANQAGGGLAETYGALFAVLALAVAARGNSWKVLLIASVLLLFAVGFKEPFVLSILAGVLLSNRVFEYSRIRIFVYSFLTAAALGCLALFALDLFGPFFNVYLPHMLGFHVHQHDGSTFIRALEIWRTFINMGAYSWTFAIAVTLLWITGARHTGIVRWIIATYLVLLAIAIGGDFYGHHFIFAVPFYVALWWGFVSRSRSTATLVITALLICTALLNTTFSYASHAKGWEKQQQQMQSAATVIDDVMDNCGWEKYLQMIPRVGDAFAYTNHVPYGPIFLHYARFIGAKRDYQTAYIRALNEANIALALDLANANLSEDAIEFIGVHFSTNPPTCAGPDFAQPEPYTLYFRKD